MEDHMTPEKLQQMIDGGETVIVEFKGEERRPLSDNDLVEAVVCLANQADDDPAWLLVGVEDDGRVTGARPRHEAGNIDPRRVQALIANRTRPSVTCRHRDEPWGVPGWRPAGQPARHGPPAPQPALGRRVQASRHR
jgi:ATP-dependent DNA helicase RecG